MPPPRRFQRTQKQLGGDPKRLAREERKRDLGPIACGLAEKNYSNGYISKYLKKVEGVHVAVATVRDWTKETREAMALKAANKADPIADKQLTEDLPTEKRTNAKKANCDPAPVLEAITAKPKRKRKRKRQIVCTLPQELPDPPKRWSEVPEINANRPPKPPTPPIVSEWHPVADAPVLTYVLALAHSGKIGYWVVRTYYRCDGTQQNWRDECGNAVAAPHAWAPLPVATFPPNPPASRRSVEQ